MTMSYWRLVDSAYDDSDELKRWSALAIEAATEDFDTKVDLFHRLDENTGPDTILATNTSSISITEIAGRTRRPQRVIGMHFMNPVPMMALVEVIRGLATSDGTTATVTAIAKQIGKTPVEVNDYPGFVANRILMPMINEAAYCVMEGVATPEAIDTVMKLGMNHPLGPLALLLLGHLGQVVGRQLKLGDPQNVVGLIHGDAHRLAELGDRLLGLGQPGHRGGQGVGLHRTHRVVGLVVIGTEHQLGELPHHTSSLFRRPVDGPVLGTGDGRAGLDCCFDLI